MPCTHTQPAQPSTLGHYLLSMTDVMQQGFQSADGSGKKDKREPLWGQPRLTSVAHLRERMC